MRFKASVLLPAFVASLALCAAPVAAGQTYVLTAAKWKAAQTSAVVAAGGVVTFSHEKGGIAVVTSDNPDFLAQVLKGGAIAAGAADEQVQLPPMQAVTLDQASITPDDEPYAFLQWHLDAVNARGAWAAGCTGAGVRVAIVDGGIWDGHPDLVPNLDTARSTSFVPGKAWNEDVGAFWHATHVAGIVAAADNGFGVVGIAPQATLIGVKVLDNGSGSFGQVIQGILYAATPIEENGAGADIINMSLGALVTKAGGHNALLGAINQAVNFAAGQGVLVVSAAGNEGVDLDHAPSQAFVPAQSGSGLGVSATGPLGWAYGATDFTRLASYSNYGNSAINVAAPGGDFAYPGNEDCTVGGLTRPCWVFDMVFSDNYLGYSWSAGTSMAAPAASAVAAIIKGSHPGISVGALKTLLQRSADDEGKKGHDPYDGHGFVNAYNACTIK